MLNNKIMQNVNSYHSKIRVNSSILIIKLTIIKLIMKIHKLIKNNNILIKIQIIRSQSLKINKNKVNISNKQKNNPTMNNKKNRCRNKKENNT